MKYMKIILLILCMDIIQAKNLKMFVGVNTKGTDSIYSSRYYESKNLIHKRRFGYQGYIGGRIGLEYYFNERNSVVGFLGIGYANMKILNPSEIFVSYYGVGSNIGLDYKYLFYKDDNFGFSVLVGANYLNLFYKRHQANILENNLIASLGFGMSIKNSHNIGIIFGVPFYSSGKFYVPDTGCVPISRKFRNLYYGISYDYSFDLF